jgi:hypothetical protein
MRLVIDRQDGIYFIGMQYPIGYFGQSAWLA